MHYTGNIQSYWYKPIGMYIQSSEANCIHTPPFNTPYNIVNVGQHCWAFVIGTVRLYNIASVGSVR